MLQCLMSLETLSLLRKILCGLLIQKAGLYLGNSQGQYHIIERYDSERGPRVTAMGSSKGILWTWLETPTTKIFLLLQGGSSCIMVGFKGNRVAPVSINKVEISPFKFRLIFPDDLRNYWSSLRTRQLLRALSVLTVITRIWELRALSYRATGLFHRRSI